MPLPAADQRDIPREVRHLHYLTAMSPNWQHITGSNNVTADALYCATVAKQSTAAATLSHINYRLPLKSLNIVLHKCP